jgi:hypothetical protein
MVNRQETCEFPHAQLDNCDQSKQDLQLFDGHSGRDTDMNRLFSYGECVLNDAQNRCKECNRLFRKFLDLESGVSSQSQQIDAG